MKRLIFWLDRHPTDWRVQLVNQLFPVVVCLVLFGGFVGGTIFFIEQLINPVTAGKIVIQLLPFDVAVGFFLYFVTAVDYALIVGRMQVANPGIRSRFLMNVFTCVGCFAGVSGVLLLWGLAKEVDWLIVLLLIFAGSVMVKLAYESLEYFENSTSIWKPLRVLTVWVVRRLHDLTQGLTFWIPELGSPKVMTMTAGQLVTWSFFLPFIIGTDDLVGYMGAMTIYNAFSLIFGIYLADILIDMLIFVSPSTTKKLVESAVLSFLGVGAFLFLTYKSYSEAVEIVWHISNMRMQVVYLIGGAVLFAYLVGRRIHVVKYKQGGVG